MDANLAGPTADIGDVEPPNTVDLLPSLEAEALTRAVASELWPRN